MRWDKKIVLVVFKHTLAVNSNQQNITPTLKDNGQKFVNIVQETVTKTIPKKKRSKKAKWLSEKALQIAEKTREMKGKGERERYTQMNAEFLRIAKRDKKILLSEQCKEIGKITEWEKLEKFKEIQESWRY